MPKTKSNRVYRVADVLHREIAKYLMQNFREDERVGMVTVVDIDVASDMKNARILISVLEESKQHEALVILNQAVGDFRTHLARNVVLRTVPKLSFALDTSFTESQHMNALFAQLNKYD